MADQYHTNEAITVVPYKALFGQQPKWGLAGRVPRTFCLNIIAEVNEEYLICLDKHKQCQQPDEMVGPIVSVLIIKMPWSQLAISPRSGEMITRAIQSLWQPSIRCDHRYSHVQSSKLSSPSMEAGSTSAWSTFTFAQLCVPILPLVVVKEGPQSAQYNGSARTFLCPTHSHLLHHLV